MKQEIEEFIKYLYSVNYNSLATSLEENLNGVASEDSLKDLYNCCIVLVSYKNWKMGVQ